MKRALAICIALVIILSLIFCRQFFADTPRDPNVLYEDSPTEELKEKIYDLTQAQKMPFYWERQPKPYLGTINNCMILSYRTNSITFDIYHKVIADCKFTWMGHFYLYAYRDGEICTLQDAYENGWLTKEHIQLIHAKHVEIDDNWGQIYQEWKNQQNQPDSRNPNVLYKDHLSKESKTRIASHLSSHHYRFLKWDYVDPYYGTINNCIILIIHPLFQAIPQPWTSVVADYTFEWDNPIYIYVYRKGVPAEACELKEAYKKGWLTKEQIGAIYKKHLDYREEFPQLLEKWNQAQEETQAS